MTAPAVERGHVMREGRLLHWVAAGSGTPTVVFEAGLTAAASQWGTILPRIAATTRALAVSRAGYGESTPVPHRRDARDSVGDLQAVLEQVQGRLILVGHSWGGLLVRLFAAQEPDRVAALVLVDATHEGLAPMRRRRSTVLGQAGMILAGHQASSGRLRRALEAGKGPLGPALQHVSEELREQAIAELCRPGTWRQARRDFPAVPALLRELHKRPLPTPAVPVVAVVGDRLEEREGASRRMVRQTYEAWVPTLPDGRLVLAPHSGHLVPQEDEELLVDVINSLVAEVR